MSILLTGANGFLGSNIIAKLIECNYKVIITYRRESNLCRIAKLLDKTENICINDIEIESIFENRSIDTIIHCATNYGRKEVNPIDVLQANLIFPLQLLHYSSNYNVRCFINTDTILDKRVSHYSLSKHQFKEWLKHYSQKMYCVNIALEHFYGPYDDKTKFVSYIISQLLERVESIDLTLGEQERDFIFIDDIVSAFIEIYKHSKNIDAGFEEYEIGTGHTVSIKYFVELIKSLAGNKETMLNFGAIPYRQNEVMKTNVDTSKLRSLGWKPIISLQDGLNLTINAERG
jgi:nucleoside-diphosphate-sugar epimerase